ncbi:hypothetical protein J2S14_002778 [Lederbergia wuyishanensis]|uniref:Uncharacterized protein n=1 Tax=Lederbergia wuyishanensis TaxID=1347903 RepID=A0ABU0D6A6_9BACI|nr:hypothetical protein [Lederbergia wuyishanensis]
MYLFKFRNLSKRIIIKVTIFRGEEFEKPARNDELGNEIRPTK